MDNISTVYSNVSSNSNNKSVITPITSLTAKLRRLKIEESILLQSINKSLPTCCQSDNEIGATNHLSSIEFKKFLNHTKKSYNELKQLFEDIKASTASKELIKSIDIDDIKKSTHKLENNIKSFKTYLHTEINALKSAERQLNQKLNDPLAISYLKRKPRVQTAKYTEIVPSPVKTIMTSPFKCIEVQEFQEFMKNSRNRYGGWNEYHHNIFINIWHKHFDAEEEFNLSSEKFDLFLCELIPKLLDVREEDVISHVRWYTKYVHLKKRQQTAIDKWRANRRLMKPSKGDDESEKEDNNKAKCVQKKIRANRDSRNKIVSDYINPKEDHIPNKETGRRLVRTCFSDKMLQKLMVNIYAEHMENDEQKSLHFLKSTKQWDIRCSVEEKINETKINNVENIRKLSYRQSLGGLE